MPPESRFGQIGPYQLERAIARTAQALLYQARDVRTGQEAALKVALPTLDRALFRQEKSILARLKHPSIVALLDAGMTSGDGSLWYAMEFLRGGSLSDLVKAGPKPAPGEKRRLDPAYVERIECLTEKICGALGHLHLQGLVHGDVKPDNILLREDGTPVLIDFGAATEFAATGRDRFKVDAHIAGTAAYMAPEQIRGDFVDARVDLYALGCVLFELVCGRPPFVGSRQECIAQHLGSDAPPVHHFAEGVPDNLSELIERLLQKRPKQRIGYADDVIQLLRSSGAGRVSLSGLPYLHRSDFYGQAEALAVVERAFETMHDAPAGLILVTGESGMGKTRFLLEASQLAQRQGLNLLTAECRELLSSSDRPSEAVDAGPLHPFERVLEDWADLTIHQLSLHPDADDPVAALAPLFPVVAQVFGLNGASTESSTNEAFRLRTAMLHVLRRLVAQGPTVLAIDDVHWADPLSLGVLRELLTDAALSLPLLCICTVRREHQEQVLARLGHGESGSSPRVRVLELEPLSRGHTAAVVSDLLGVETPDHTIVDAVYRVSEGQPFMVGELLRSAIAKEVVVRNEAGAWGVKRTNEEVVRALELEIPRSLESLIAQRCADLSPQANAVLRVASALGRDFRQDVVSRITADLSGHDQAEIQLALEELVRRQVLVKSESTKYRFVHDRLRELPYLALSDSERRRIHLHAAATLEAMGGANPQMDATSAGLHWSRVGVHDRAAACFGRAADAARVAFAHEQAIAMYEAALRELDATEDPPAPLRSRLWEGLGDVLLRIGDNENAERALRAAVSAFPDLSVSRRAELMQKIARTLQNRFMAKAALEALGAAEAVLENAPGHRELYASIQIERAWIHYWHGEVAEMEVALSKVPESVEQTFGPELQTRYFEVLTLAGFRREKYRVTAQTVDAARRALAAARLTRDTQALMTSQWMLGLALLFAGDLQGAEPALTESAELASKRGDAKHERAARAYLALVYRLRGDVHTVRNQCEELLATAPTGLLAVWTALSDANLGWTSLRLGQLDEARLHLDKARAFWKSMPSPYPFQWTGLLPYLELQLRQGESGWVDTARQLLDEALHPLPDPIASALNEALRCEAAEDTELALGCAWKAVDLSRSRGLA